MRIGVNCIPLQPRIGGLRQYFQRLFRELLTNDFDHNYIFFYADHNLPELDLIGNDRWQQGAIRVAGDGEILPHLMKVDLLFCPFAVLWPRPLPVASVVELADIQEVFYPQFFTDADISFRKTHFAPSTRTADAVITLSEHSRKTIVEHHHVGPDKIFVTNLTVEESFHEPVDPAITADLNLPDKFVFFPANHWQHKNHDALLRALRILKDEQGLSVPAIFTGHDMGNGYPLVQKIEGYGLSGQVRVLGYLASEEIRGIYQRATLLCFPSLFEGFGMPVLEAMASGCPVACSNTTSLPEVGDDVVLYFNPNDPREIASSIAELWVNEELCKDLVARGREWAKSFTPSRMAETHLNAFHYAYSKFNPESRQMYSRYLYEPLERLYETENKLYGLQSSLSWRMTAPFRLLADKVRDLL